MKKIILVIFAAFGISTSSNLFADDIKIPVGSQSSELSNIARPSLGMTKSIVQKQFGEPLKQSEPKGKPPISNWEYADFVVYFENDHVIHSVLKPKHHESETILIEETVEMKEDDLKLK